MISAPVGGLCVLLPEVHNWAVSPTLARDSLDPSFSWQSAASPGPRRGGLSCRFCEIEFGRRAPSDNVLLIRGRLPHEYDAFSDLKAFYARYNRVRRRTGWENLGCCLPGREPTGPRTP
jgi:hypothetical protein